MKKIYVRIDELEYQLACGDMMMREADDARNELAQLEDELAELRVNVVNK